MTLSIRLFFTLGLLLFLGPATFIQADEVAPVAKAKSEIIPFVPNGTTNFGTVALNFDDLDSDGLPNNYELANGLKPDDPSDALLDSDGDGLLNIEEFNVGTDPQDPDTDNDGFTDFEELFAATDPLDDQDFPNAPPVIPTLVSLDVQPNGGNIIVNSIVGSVPTQLTVLGLFSDSSQQDLTANVKTSYQTSDPTIAVVSSTGEVVGVDSGIAVITVTHENVSIQVLFNVERFEPEIIGKTNVGFVSAIAINQPHVFLGRTSGLTVYNVSVPESPVLVISNQDVGGAINDLRVVGQRLYVAVSGMGLKIFDTSALPASPVEIGSLVLPGIVSLDLDGSQLVASLGSQIVLIDVADPTTPVSTHTVMATTQKVAVDALRNVVYSTGGNILEVYFADPSGQLLLQSSLSTTASIRDLDINQSTVYLALPSPFGLQTVDTSNLLDPLLVGTVPDSFNSFGIRYFDDHIFLAENLFTNLVPIINVSDPANPILAGNPQSGDDAEGRDIDVSGNLVAVATNEGFQLVRWLTDNFGLPPQITDFTVLPTTLVGGLPITVQAAAIDDVAVSSFELLIDGEVVQQISGNPVTFQAPTSLSVGSEVIAVQVRALDIGGNSTLSAVQNIDLLADIEAPSIEFVSPLAGQVLTPGVPFDVIVNASDNVAVDRVEFFLDDVLTATASVPTFGFSFVPTVPNFETTVNLKAVVFDKALPVELMSQAEVNVQVPALQSVQVTPETGVLVGAGSVLTLTVTGIFLSGDTVDLTSPASGTVYQSSDESIATVSSQGAVTAVGNGLVSITVQNGSVQRTVEFDVFAAPDPADTTPSETQIVALAAAQSSLTFPVAFTVISGADDLAAVQLFFRRGGSGNFSVFRPEGNDQGFFFDSPIPFDTNFTGGDGFYEFYTSALDVNGNQELAPETFVTTVVDTGQTTIVLTNDTLIDENDFTFDFQKVRVQGATLTVNGEHTFASLEIVDGAVLTHEPTTLSEVKTFLIRTPSLVVDASSAIDVSDRGFLGGFQGGNEGLGRTLGNVPVTLVNAAGSFGGLGGEGNIGERVPSYGDYRNPVEPGTGGSNTNPAEPSGNGGGVIHLDVGILDLEGAIRANGGGASGVSLNRGRGGSGGSILLNVQTLQGSGLIEARGGVANGISHGGGGRIAIYYDDLSQFDQNQIQAFGVRGANPSADSGAGTIFLKSSNQQFGELIVDTDGIDTNTFRSTTPGRFVGVGKSESLVYQAAINRTILTDSTAAFPIPGSVVGALGLVGIELNPNVDQNQTFTIVDNTSTTLTVVGDMTQVAQVGDPYSGVDVFDRVEVKNNSDLGIEDQILQAGVLDLRSGSVISHVETTLNQTHRLHIKAQTINVEAGAAIDVSRRGFLGGFQDGNDGLGRTLGNVPVPANFVNAAGSFGGLGGEGDTGERVPSYGDYRNPVEPGTGGSNTTANEPSGNGGGVIRLDADTLNVDGTVRANGGNALGFAGGGSPGRGRGGSGGSILLNVQTLQGNGLIEAIGGQAINTSHGGGGRIALYYNDISQFDLANITRAFGLASSNLAHASGAGTVFLQSSSQVNGELIINNNGIDTNTFQATTLGRFVGVGESDSLDYDPVKDETVLTDLSASFTVPGTVVGEIGLVGLNLNPNVDQDQSFKILANTDQTITVQGDMTQVAQVGDPYSGVDLVDRILIDNNTDFGVEDQIVQAGVLDLKSGSVISHMDTTLNQIHRLHIKAQTINIDAGTAIDVTGKGFLGADQPGNPGDFGRTLGNVLVTIPSSGGSFGGLGGVSGGGERVPGYGDYRNPVEPGTGGSSSTFGGNGGGVIRLDADVLSLEGSIRSNGIKAGTLGSASGSGGSILLNVQTLTGSGTIEAKIFDSAVFVGGGGRIAIYYEDISGFDLANVQAFGGQNGSSQPALSGGAGTIFLKSTSQPFGELIIDNDGIQTNTLRATTLGRFVGVGESEDLVHDPGANTTVLTDTSANFPLPGAVEGALGLVGLDLNPNIEQDQVFTIIDNTATTITVQGDMTQVANVGDSYSGVSVLDGVLVTDNTDLGIEDQILQLGLLELRNGSVLSHVDTTTTEIHRLYVKADTIDIDATSAIDVSGRGFLGANQPGNPGNFGRTLGNVLVETPDSGGSFGGLGGVFGGFTRVPGYGDYRNPVEPGTGGSSSTVSGSGGGVIRLDVGVLSLEGAVRSNGQDVSFASGSGGSILLNVQTLTGGGTIEAKENSFNEGRRGGGGRIAIYYEDISGFDLDNIQAFGGQNIAASFLSGGAGTIFLKSASQSIGELIIDNNGIKTTTLRATTLGRFVGMGESEDLIYDVGTDTTVLSDTTASFPLPGAVEGAIGLVGLDLNPNVEQDQIFTILDNTATTITVQGDMTQVASVGDTYRGVNVLDGLLVTDNTDFGVEDQTLQVGFLTLSNGSLMSHMETTLTKVHHLHVKADTVDIDATSAIDVTGRGFLGAGQGGNGLDVGFTQGNVPTPGNPGQAGGSYGGLGGRGNNPGDARTFVYGDFKNPIFPGSGGSRISTGQTGVAGGNGGGVVRLDVSSTCVVDGQILADGLTGSQNQSGGGGGAGGSILIQTSVLQGTGQISVVGNRESLSAGGGGGRIAIYYDDISGFNLAGLQAFSDGFSPQSSGGAGTIYLKSSAQVEGDLIIDNNNSDTDVTTTPLRSIGSGTNTNLTATVLTDTTASFPEPDPVTGALGLIGLELNPNTDQTQTFVIVDNTAITLTVLGDLTQVAQTGDSYQGVYRFNEVEIRQSAHFSSFDQLLANKANVNDAQATFSGQVQVNDLDLINGGLMTIPDSSISFVHRLQLLADTVDIDSTSRLDVSGKGFVGSRQNGNDLDVGFTQGNVPTPGNPGQAGGSHGGLGGRGSNPGDARTFVYGDFKNPTFPGSGGSRFDTGQSGIFGGNGGGALHLDISSTLTLDGKILAEGFTGTPNKQGGASGAGGSILIQTNQLTGSGEISSSSRQDTFSVGGGGGRIAIFYDDISGFDQTQIKAFSGGFNSQNTGGAGTIFLKSSAQAEGDLIINGNNLDTDVTTTPLRSVGVGSSTSLRATILTDTTASFPEPDPLTGALGLIGLALNPNTDQDQTFLIIDNTATTITVLGDMTQVAQAGDSYQGVYGFNEINIEQAARFSLLDQLLANKASVNDAEASLSGRSELSDLDLINSGLITIPDSSTSFVHRLELVAETINVDSTSRLDVSGKGFVGSRQNGNDLDVGFTQGNVPTPGNPGQAGGSHGGLGGRGQNPGDSRTFVYGDFKNPTFPGSGGSRFDTGQSGVFGGNGGGVIRLDVSNALTLDGKILANGFTGTQNKQGGASGAGGSILIHTSSLTGSGEISASSLQDTFSVGGGGGRIAIFYDDISGFDRTHLQAFGLGSNLQNSGGAGTIFLKSQNQTHGELIVDNNGRDTETFTTLLRNVGTGTSRTLVYDALADTTDLTDNNAQFDQPDPVTGALGLIGLQLNPQLNQAQTFLVIGNNANTVTVMGDMTQVASPGDTYIGTYFLDGLTLKGKARLKTDDRVVITGSPGFVFDNNDAIFMFGDFQFAGNGVDLSLTNLTLTLPNDDGTTYGVIDLNNSTLILDGQGAFVVDDFDLTNNSTLTITDPTSTSVSVVKLDVTNTLSVDPTSSITVTDKGFLGGLRGDNVSSDAITLGFSPLGSQLSDGGSYGGLGGINSSGGDPNRDFVNPIYGSVIAPVDPGSGGGGTINGQGSGGNGGSVVSIDATDLVVDGTIESRGGDGQGNEGAPGSGGSILLSVSNTISGTGSISANGGNRSGSGAGGGGGGRVALYFSDMSGFTGSLSATGGTGIPAGMDGTVFSQMGALLSGGNDSPTKTLIYDHKDRPGARWVTVPVIENLNHLEVLGCSKVQWQDTLNFSGQESSIFVSKTSQLKGQALSFVEEAALKIKGLGRIGLESLHLSDHQNSALILERATLILIDDALALRVPTLKLIEGATLTTRHQKDGRPIRLRLQVRELKVGPQSAIDVSGLGYLGAAQGINQSLTGRTYSREDPTGTTHGGSGFNSGGSHRTLGKGLVPGFLYGSARAPTTFGSGGGSLDFENPGGNGGGAIHIEAQFVKLEGLIAANGQDSAAGAGAGGSILIQADYFVKTGRVQVSGGLALSAKAHPGGEGYIFITGKKIIDKKAKDGVSGGVE